MRSIRLMGMALVAVLAFSVVAVASASASEPTYLKCGKATKVGTKYTGGYNNKTCTEVNAKGEGKYATSALPLPTKFTGTSKISTFYYSKAGKIVWEVKCTKDKDSGTIEEPAYFEGAITFSSCSASNEVSHAKAEKCAKSVEVPVIGILREKTVPASPHPGVTALFQAPAYSCGTVSFEISNAYPFITGEVSPTAKGELGDWRVDPSTGLQSLEGWIEEGKPSTWPPVEANVTVGASSESMRFGLETSEPIGPSKEVVIQ